MAGKTRLGHSAVNGFFPLDDTDANTRGWVDPALGALLIPDGLDFRLPSPRPLAFTRTYASYNPHIGPLGPGWSISGASTRLEVTENNTFVVIDAHGRRINFGALEPGQSRYSAFEMFSIRRGGPEALAGSAPPKPWTGRWLNVPEDLQRDPFSVLIEARGDYMHFKLQRTGWCLVSTFDRNVYSTEYAFNDIGLPVSMVDSAGRYYQLVYRRISSGTLEDTGLRLAGVTLGQQRVEADDPKVDWLVRYEYNSSGDLAVVLDSSGQCAHQFEWRDHILVTHRMPSGVEYRCEWSGHTYEGKVRVLSEVGGLTRRYEYHPNYSVVTDSQGRREEFHFGDDALRRCTEHIRADGSRVQYRYDSAGRLITVIDPLERITHLLRDAEGRYTGMQLPNRARYQSALDGETGLPRQLDYPENITVQIEYDSRGNPVRAKNANGMQTRYRYGDPRLPDRPTEVVDPDGNIHCYAWDEFGQIMSYTDCMGKNTSYRYNDQGQLLSVTNALGQTVRHEYNPQGKRSGTLLTDGRKISYQYDPTGHLIEVALSDGRYWRFAYDWGRLVQSGDYTGAVHDFMYDEAWRLVQKLVNRNGNAIVCRFEYDVMDRIVRKTDSNGQVEDYQYDSAGQLVRQIVECAEGVSSSVDYEYDAAGRLVSRHLPKTAHIGAMLERFHWRMDGRIAAIENDYSRVDFIYDEAGRLTSEIQVHGSEGQPEWRWLYQHDYKKGRVRSNSIYGDLSPIEWSFYKSGDLHGVNLPGLGRIEIERDDLLREVERNVKTRNNVLLFACDTQHTPLGQLAERQFQRMGRVVSAWRYQYDDLGRLVSIIDAQNPEAAIHYAYDDVHPHGAAACRFDAPDSDITDPAFFTSKMDDVPESSHDPIGSLDSDNYLIHPSQLDEGIENIYDRAGNLIERGFPDGSCLKLYYDGARRLAYVTRTDLTGVTIKTSYAYDAFSRRIRKDVFQNDVAQGTTHFGWEGKRLVIIEEKDRELRTTLIYEPDGSVPIARVDQSLAGSEQYAPVQSDAVMGKLLTDSLFMAREQFAITRMAVPEALLNVQAQQYANPPKVMVFVCDHRDVPLMLIDAGGNVVWKAEADDLLGTGERREKGIRQLLRLYGQCLDEETGLHYLHPRYFDPATSRPVAHSPIELPGGLEDSCLNSAAEQRDRRGVIDLGTGCPGKKELLKHITGNFPAPGLEYWATRKPWF